MRGTDHQSEFSVTSLVFQNVIAISTVHHKVEENSDRRHENFSMFLLHVSETSASDERTESEREALIEGEVRSKASAPSVGQKGVVPWK